MRVLAMTETPAATRGYAWYVVGLVCALYVLSYLDRLILGLLVQPIQAEISVSDTQMSLLFGMAFAGVFAVAGLPLARIADTSRRARPRAPTRSASSRPGST